MTGKEIWRAKPPIPRNGETLTMAPLVVKGKVLVGNSGAENGARWLLAALDARTRPRSSGAPTAPEPT
jgi:alcohol dehydrogenase (cytochrome c)